MTLDLPPRSYRSLTTSELPPPSALRLRRRIMESPGDLNLWPPNSNQTPVEPTWTCVSNLKDLVGSVPKMLHSRESSENRWSLSLWSSQLHRRRKINMKINSRQKTWGLFCRYPSHKVQSSVVQLKLPSSLPSPSQRRYSKCENILQPDFIYGGSECEQEKTTRAARNANAVISWVL